MRFRHFRPLFVYAVMLGGILASASAQQVTVTKLFDFGDVVQDPGSGIPAGLPYDSPVLLGTELWFTTQRGGIYDSGTLSSYNLSTNLLTRRLNDLDSITGGDPRSSVTFAGEYVYYTTYDDGVDFADPSKGGNGTIRSYHRVTGASTTLFVGPKTSTTSDPQPNLPRIFGGNVTYVDNGDGTADLYTTYSSGGVNAVGGIQKLTINIATQQTVTSSLVYTFAYNDLNNAGRQPFEGFTRVGDKLYFTLAQGGTPSVAPNPNPQGVPHVPNGPGVLGILDLATDTVDLTNVLPLTDGSSVLPQHNVTYDAERNCLYLTTNGISAQPGALLKFDLGSKQFTVLKDLSSSPGFPDGRFPVGSVGLVDDLLFFTAWQGGASNGGVINMFNLTTGLFSKVADLTNTVGDNFGGSSRGGFASFQDSSGYHLFLLTNKGGESGYGTILRLDVIPEPGVGMLACVGLGFLLNRRRRCVLRRIPA